MIKKVHTVQVEFNQFNSLTDENELVIYLNEDTSKDFQEVIRIKNIKQLNMDGVWVKTIN